VERRISSPLAEAHVGSWQFDPKDLAGKRVSIEIARARGRVERIEGKITFVSPIVVGNGTFRVWAEFDNAIKDGQWMTPPGLKGKMRYAGE
jgi:hypothetical protein